jgi:hypothetical protein
LKALPVALERRGGRGAALTRSQSSLRSGISFSYNTIAFVLFGF